MKLSLLFLLMSSLSLVGCGINSPRHPDHRGGVEAREKTQARGLVVAGTLVIRSTTNGTPARGEKVTSDCPLFLRLSIPGGKQDEFDLCVNEDHLQYTEFASLQEGDKVQFQLSEEYLQRKPDKARYLRFTRVR